MWILVLIGVGVIVLAGGLLYQHVGTARDARRFPLQGRAFDIGTRKVHVDIRGAGRPPVWFESAIAASSLSWARVQPGVAKFTTACSYDRAGLGWSEPAATPRTVSRVVGDLRALIRMATGGTPCVLVGHSFGAFICTAFATTHPGEVCGLVLVDPPTDWMTMTRRQVYLLRGARQMSSLGGALARLGIVRACVALLTGGAPGVPRQFIKVFGAPTATIIERLIGEIRKLPPEVHPLVQGAWCQPKSFRAMADYLRVFEEVALSARSHQIPRDMPVVVISAGDQSNDVTAAHEQLARSSSLGRHIVASNSGHWVPFDEPDLIVDAIRELARPLK